MQILRRTALLLLWAFAGVGVLCAGVWGATAAGWIQPLIVVSGSMEPQIMTGDLVIDTKAPAASLEVGDVVSLPSQLTDRLVTHRIASIRHEHDDVYTVTLKGDNNAFPDVLDYPVSGDVWTPAVRLPGWGGAVMQISTPGVAVPLLAGLVGLAGLTVLIPRPEPRAPALQRTDA